MSPGSPTNRELANRSLLRHLCAHRRKRCSPSTPSSESSIACRSHPRTSRLRRAHLGRGLRRSLSIARREESPSRARRPPGRSNCDENDRRTTRRGRVCNHASRCSSQGACGRHYLRCNSARLRPQSGRSAHLHLERKALPPRRPRPVRSNHHTVNSNPHWPIGHMGSYSTHAQHSG